MIRTGERFNMGFLCFETQRGGNAPERSPFRPTALARYGLLAVAVMLLWPTPGSRAQTSAPLDSLQAGAVIEVDQESARYAAPKIDISRKLLPDVQATQVPTARTPKQPPRIDDPVAGRWNYHMARLAQRQGDGDASRKHLKAALTDDPVVATYQWWQIQKALRDFDTATLTQAAPRAWATLLESPLARGRLFLRLHQGFLVLTVIFWSVLLMTLGLVSSLVAARRVLAIDPIEATTGQGVGS